MIKDIICSITADKKLKTALYGRKISLWMLRKSEKK